MAKCKHKPSLASQLRHRITIEVKTESIGSTGEPLETWATFKTVRAAIIPALGREFYQAYQEQSENMVKFKLRYSSDLSGLNASDHRITYNSQTYDIHSVINVNTRNEEILIMCRLHNA